MLGCARVDTQRAGMVVDGSEGEGGGQILRTSITLGMMTGSPVRVRNIRGKRSKPGLMRSHLTAVRAAAAVCRGRLTGAELGSTDLVLEPGAITHGEYELAVGSAGSTTLVLQTILYPLLLTPGESTIELSGGTHNPMAPTFDYLEQVLAPHLRQMGAQFDLELSAPGYYPNGGGKIIVKVRGGTPLSRIEILHRGEISGRLAHALVSDLPISIAHRELIVVQRKLDWPWTEMKKERVRGYGPGNVLSLSLYHGGGVSMFTGFGEKGLASEEVAERCINAVLDFSPAHAPVDPHLADQLLLPMALAGGGAYRTVEPTEHTMSNAKLIQRFLPVEIAIRREGQLDYRVDVWRR